MRLALAEGGLLVCSRAGQVLGHLGVGERHQEEMLGSAASPV